ncbi:hypothetical protein ACNKHN_15955 [Shigella flexneri]
MWALTAPQRPGAVHLGSGSAAHSQKGIRHLHLRS